MKSSTVWIKTIESFVIRYLLAENYCGPWLHHVTISLIMENNEIKYVWLKTVKSFVFRYLLAKNHCGS